jgi:hypothetical protein
MQVPSRTSAAGLLAVGLGAIAAGTLMGAHVERGARGVVRIAGRAELSYTKRETVDAPIPPGHQLSVGQTVGKNRNEGQTDYFAGANVVNVETADLVRGTGSHQGYYTMGKDADTAVAQWLGTVTTTMSPQEQPMTSFHGTWSYVYGSGQYAGLKGSGTYKGQFLTQDRYMVSWEGDYTK